MSYIAPIGEIRNNEKLTFTETFNRAIIKTVGEENQYNEDYIEAVREGKFKRHLAWRKIINPFKWVEFLATLTADMVDRISQIGARKPTRAAYSLASSHGYATDVDEIQPAYGFSRSLIRGIFKITIGLPVAILKHFTSPINQLFRPLLHYAQKHPRLFWGVIVPVAVLFTAFVALALFTSGIALPAGLLWLAAIPGFAKGLTLIASAASFVSIHIPFVAPLTAGIITKAAFLATGLFASLKFMHDVVANTASIIRDIYHDGRETKLEKQTKGAFSLGVVNTTHENTLSRLLFNTPKTQEPLRPRDQDCGYGFRSFVGGYSYSPLPPREHTYSGLMMHHVDTDVSGSEHNKRRSRTLATDAQHVVEERQSVYRK